MVEIEVIDGEAVEVLVCWCPGRARGKGRPRARLLGSGKASRVLMHTDPKDLQAEALVRAAWLTAHKGRAPLTGAVGVSIEVRVARPAGADGGGRWAYWREASATGRAVPVGKPDADNVGKSVLDALNGCAWLDDSQVSDLRVRKVWAGAGEPGGVLVRAWAVPGWVDRPR